MKPSDPLAPARAALLRGELDSAIDLAWRAVRPAVIAQDNAVLQNAMQFANEIAAHSTGEAHGDAEKLSAYCAACIARPREEQGGVFSTRRLFSFGGSQKKKCPDCAERIQVDAKVCRFCGFRFDDPT